MINRDEIEAGDKVYTRDGGCLVARIVGEGLLLGGVDIDGWELDGQYSSFHDHPLDIIRIEKAPKPVVEVRWLMWDDELTETYLDVEDNLYAYKHAIKLTIKPTKARPSMLRKINER